MNLQKKIKVINTRKKLFFYFFFKKNETREGGKTDNNKSRENQQIRFGRTREKRKILTSLKQSNRNEETLEKTKGNNTRLNLSVSNKTRRRM